MATQKDCDTEAMELQQEGSHKEKVSDTLPLKARISQAVPEEALRKSVRQRKLTEKGQALHEEKVSRLQARFKVSYDK